MEEIAEVYARSLFDVAVEHDELDDVREQLDEFADVLERERELQVFFFSPYFATAEKEQGIDRMLSDAHPTLMRFLHLLIEKHRMPVIFRIRRRLDAMWEDHNRMLPVEITSAVALDEQTTAQIGKQISQRTGRRVELQTNVEPDILGGIVVRVGNSILDASIRNRLEQLRKQVARA